MGALCVGSWGCQLAGGIAVIPEQVPPQLVRVSLWHLPFLCWSFMAVENPLVLLCNGFFLCNFLPLLPLVREVWTYQG